MDDFKELPDVNFLFSKINDIEQQVEKDIQKIKLNVTNKIDKIESDARIKINKLKLQIEKKKVEFYLSGQYDKYETATIYDLDHLTLQQLIFLVYKIFGENAKCENFRDGPVLSRFFIYGDVSYARHGDEAFKCKLVGWLGDKSCEYCGYLSHYDGTCHIRDTEQKTKQCTVCYKQGHRLSECRDLIALRKRCAGLDECKFKKEV